MSGGPMNAVLVEELLRFTPQVGVVDGGEGDERDVARLFLDKLVGLKQLNLAGQWIWDAAYEAGRKA